ncbi:MAG: tetratricopeptide repeat protein [Bdellovibrionales bacterium]|nr:tetratricopeptide repeat protein [Bdellovibrionales bacterium]
MKFLNLTILLFSVFSFSGCATRQQTVNKNYQKQVNRLTQQLRKQKMISNELKDENLVLRQLAGVPEPALSRVQREGKRDLKVYSEKFLYSQIITAFKKEDRKKLSRAVTVFLKQYPKSQRADNAIYYKALLDFRSGRLAESLEEFDRILDHYPKANKTPSAILGKGLAYKALNLSDQAKIMFENVMNKYPKTPEYIRAKREIREIEKKSL